MSTSSFWSGPVRGGAPSAAQAASSAGLTAAGNLFDKAVGALAQGDEDKARRLAAQAADRPFDDHEGIWPGPWAAHFALFQLVTNEIEEWPEGDHTWIDALEDLAAGASGRQLRELRHLAAVLRQDARLLGVDEHEARQLGRLTGGADPAEQPADEVSEGERADYVLELARLVLAAENRFGSPGEPMPAPGERRRPDPGDASVRGGSPRRA